MFRPSGIGVGVNADRLLALDPAGHDPPERTRPPGQIRWRIEHDYRELKTGLGLAHFEGRTYAGWHHHMTLVTAAHLFITQLRLTRPKAVGAG